MDLRNLKSSVLIILFLLLNIIVVGQEIPILEPQIEKPYNFLEKQKIWSKCDSLDIGEFPKGKFTQEELNDLSNKCDDIDYSFACDDIFAVVCGDHWIDGGYPITFVKDKDGQPIPTYNFVTVSSALKSQKGNSYDKKSIRDLSYATAWVEGVKGYGIGEYIEFKFPHLNPRITTVKIANGYIKDKNAWKNNSRVKQLKVYLNEEEFAILNLKDVYAEQTFEIPTIGYQLNYGLNNDGTNWWWYKDKNGNTVKSYHNKELSDHIIRFEIMSIYKGDKYDDTAITEIYFEGLDVH